LLAHWCILLRRAVRFLRRLHTRRSLDELDAVENFIYGLAPFDLTAFLQQNPEAMIAVFAYQYRAGARAPHRRYADMAYSRTGVPRVVRTAQQRLRDDTLATARFQVPARTASNRFAESSLQIPATNFRLAPEYVNIRHEFVAEGAPLRDLKALLGAQFLNKLNAGGYLAVHFVDDSADGAILARVAGIGSAIPASRQLPAFSLVTAPDFFPNADQVAISRWAATVSRHFSQGGPRLLSRNQMRATANIECSALALSEGLSIGTIGR
jgi:hypothetical protein